MLGPVHVLRTQTPGPIAEGQNEKQKEDSRHFQEHTAAYARKRSQESADTPSETPTCADGALRGNVRALRTHAGDGDGTGCGGGRARNRLARHAARDSHADAQNPSDGLRPHPSMMLAAHRFLELSFRSICRRRRTEVR